MRRIQTSIKVALVFLQAMLCLAGLAQAPSSSTASGKTTPSGALAPRLQDLGDHVFPVTTKSKQAELFINQGLNLAYGF